MTFKEWRRELSAILAEGGSSLYRSAVDDARRAWLEGTSPLDFYRDVLEPAFMLEQEEAAERPDLRELGL